MRRFYIYIGAFALLPGLALADATQQSNFKFSGYVDGSYNYLVRSNVFTSGTFNRVYDLEPNGFTLQQAAVTASYQPTLGFGGLVNIIGGRDANEIAPYGLDPYLGSQTLAIDPTQVYLQYARGPFTIIGGLFISLAGEEVINPTLNTNFSRSILDGYAEPFTHMGFRGTYVVNDKVSLITGLNNGWDSIRDTGRRKTIELGVEYTPNSTYSLTTLLYTGGQRATDRTATGSATISRPMPKAEPSGAASTIWLPVEVARKPAAAASAARFDAMFDGDVWPAPTTYEYGVPFSVSVQVSPTFAVPLSVRVGGRPGDRRVGERRASTCGRLPSVIDCCGRADEPVVRRR